MGDFVGKEEVEAIQEHYKAYLRSKTSKSDNRAEPVSGVYDASTFREVSSWYVDRLLRYIEVQDWIAEAEAEAPPGPVTTSPVSDVVNWLRERSAEAKIRGEPLRSGPDHIKRAANEEAHWCALIADQITGRWGKAQPAKTPVKLEMRLEAGVCEECERGEGRHHSYCSWVLDHYTAGWVDALDAAELTLRDRREFEGEAIVNEISRERPKETVAQLTEEMFAFFAWRDATTDRYGEEFADEFIAEYGKPGKPFQEVPDEHIIAATIFQSWSESKQARVLAEFDKRKG